MKTPNQAVQRTRTASAVHDKPPTVSTAVPASADGKRQTANKMINQATANIVLRGTWLYDALVPCEILIECRNIAYGTDDYEDDPDIAEDKKGTFYYILYQSAGKPGDFSSEVGPFDTIEEAKVHCTQATHGSIIWHTGNAI